MKMQFKLAVRQVALFSPSGLSLTQELQMAATVGDIDPETCRGYLKQYACANSPEAFAALNPPEDGKLAVLIDFTLREGATDDHIAAIVAGADAAFEMFVAPMLEQIPPMPQVPGMKEGKPYLAHSISKVNVDGTDFLRFIVFSGLDPASLWRDADIDIHDFVPSIHQAAYQAYAFSDLISAENPAKIKDFFTGRIEYDFTWNTRMLAALQALVKHEPLFQMMGVDNSETQDFRTVAAAFARVFSKQSTSIEVSFNGYQDLAEAAILDFAIPKYEKQMMREGVDTEEEMYKLIGGKPSDEKISELIAALGEVSGKTIGNMRKDALNFGALLPTVVLQDFVDPVPSTNYEGGFPPSDEALDFVTPLWVFKYLLGAVPEDFAIFKDAGLGFLSAVSGVGAARFSSEMAKAGIEARGMDLFMLLPTPEEIMAQPDPVRVTFTDPEYYGPPFARAEVMEHAITNANFYMRLAGQTVKEAFESGATSIEEIGSDEEAVAMINRIKDAEALAYTAEELAEFQDKYSEVLDLVKLAVPMGKPAFDTQLPWEHIPGGDKKKEFAEATFTKITNIEL